MIDLGLTAAQFWELTPWHISILFDRYRARERRLAINSALLVSSYLNVHRDRDKHPDAWGVEQFMPFPPEPTYNQNNGAQPTGMSTEEQIKYLRAWAHASGAIVKKRGSV